MLKEFPVTTQKGGLPRRWFADDYFDIIVWTRPDSKISGFQVCYDRSGRERALTWTEKHGFRHDRVDDGEPLPTKNQTPVLVPDGLFPARKILELFVSRSQGIDAEIRWFIAEKLRGYPDADSKA